MKKAENLRDSGGFNGKDLRALPLIERKAALKKLLRRKRSRIQYLDPVEGDGRLLFEQIVKMDLEGIVCKRKDSPYKVTEKPTRHWIKVKNSQYSYWRDVKNFLSMCETHSDVNLAALIENRQLSLTRRGSRAVDHLK